MQKRKTYSAILFWAEPDEPGMVYKMDVIKIDEKFYLVPTCLEEIGGKHRTPERAIPIDQFPHQRSIGRKPADFVINGPVPKPLFFAKEPELEVPRFEVVLSPYRQHVKPVH